MAKENPNQTNTFGVPNKEKQKEVNYFMSEDRRRANNFSDPLFLNFKFLIEFDATHGLFGVDDPNYPDTAMSYLRRIGDLNRLEMLKTYTNLFKSFIQKYDYLIKTIDGLDLIHNKSNSHSFYSGEDNKLSIEIEEEIDMIAESLVFMYRKLTFDETRMVYVIPQNLLKFDCKVLLYASGYYDKYYDVQVDETNKEINSDDVSKFVVPTKKKLNDDNDIKKVMSLRKGYNHLLFSVEDCSFNVEESGRTLMGMISNEVSDDVAKNNLVINFQNGTYEGMFNNLVGQVSWVEILAETALYTKQQNLTNKNIVSSEEIKKKTSKNKFKDLVKRSKEKGFEYGKNIVDSVKTILIDDKNKLVNSLVDTGRNIQYTDTAILSYGLKKLRENKNSSVKGVELDLSVEQKNLIKNNFGLGLL